MVSSAAQLLVVLPAAEPAHTGSPGVGGNQSAEKSGDTHRYAMDSCPVMVAGPSYSTGAKVGTGYCDKCCNTARQEWYYGVKLHVFVILRPGRLPLLRAAQISPPSCPDLLAAKQMDRDCSPVSFGRLFADQAYCDVAWAESLEKCRDIEIITPRKRRRYDVLRSGDCSHFAASSAHQPIESVFHWANLKSAFQVASRARSLSGIVFLLSPFLGRCKTNLSIFTKIWYTIYMYTKICRLRGETRGTIWS